MRPLCLTDIDGGQDRPGQLQFGGLSGVQGLDDHDPGLGLGCSSTGRTSDSGSEGSRFESWQLRCFRYGGGIAPGKVHLLRVSDRSLRGVRNFAGSARRVPGGSHHRCIRRFAPREQRSRSAGTCKAIVEGAQPAIAAARRLRGLDVPRRSWPAESDARGEVCWSNRAKRGRERPESALAQTRRLRSRGRARSSFIWCRRV